MNDQETAALIRMVKALCPAQKFDELTPDAWLLVLDDIPIADAVEALKPLARTHRFIAPADIAEQVKRRHGQRPDTASVADAVREPDADPDDVAGYIAALRAGTRRHGELERPRPVGALLAAAFQHVPTGDPR